MWSFWCLFSFLTSACLADVSSFYFCSDMNPQQHVNIEQLMGMWYGIEILTHDVEEHYVRIGTSCPILHLSEDKDYPITTYSPLYKNYDYRYNYGERRPPNTRPNERNNYEYDQYGRPTQYPHNKNYNTRRYGTRNFNGKDYQFSEKRLRIWWDENGSGTEYHLRYNTSRPGFWISSGPQNGSELEPAFSHFAGTIQIIKAVGNHLVLTFCHQLPQRQLYTVLLSRQNKLDKADIHSVHSLLNRKGLNTNAIKKVCWNGSESVRMSLGTLFLLVESLLLCYT
jgi:hypothetical protein